MNCGANKTGATASISNNGQRTETYDLAAECRSKVVGLHVHRRGEIISTPGYHLQQVSNFFSANRWSLLDRTVSFSKRLPVEGSPFRAQGNNKT